MAPDRGRDEDALEPAEGSEAMDIDDLGHIRHDLKNLVTSLVSGCTLIEALSGPDASADLREILAEMRAELERGRATVDRLKAFEDGLRES